MREFPEAPLIPRVWRRRPRASFRWRRLSGQLGGRSGGVGMQSHVRTSVSPVTITGLLALSCVVFFFVLRKSFTRRTNWCQAGGQQELHRSPQIEYAEF